MKLALVFEHRVSACRVAPGCITCANCALWVPSANHAGSSVTVFGCIYLFAALQQRGCLRGDLLSCESPAMARRGHVDTFRLVINPFHSIADAAAV